MDKLPTNNIPATENKPAQLLLLRAQRRLYDRARRFLILQVVVTVGLPTAAAVAVLVWPSLKPITASLAFIATILDATVFERVQKSLRRLAAKVQEQFDCEVLELPWDRFILGAHPDPERIHEAANASGNADETLLRDWYPVSVGGVPIHLGRVICQRTNVVYDSRLRRAFGTWALCVAITLAILLFLAGALLQLAVGDLVLSVGAPVVPILIWGVKEYYRQLDAARMSEFIKGEAERLWTDAISGKCAPADCKTESRMFQNAMFERRKSAPVIFKWIYRTMRSKLEGEMNAGVEALVKAAKKSLS